MKTIEKTSKASKATTKKSTTAKSALYSPAIRKGIVAAFLPILDGESEGESLRDYLTTRQMNRLDREAIAQGFDHAGEYVSAFMDRAITNFMEDFKAKEQAKA